VTVAVAHLEEMYGYFLAKSENIGVENFPLKSGHIEEIMADSSLM